MKSAREIKIVVRSLTPGDVRAIMDLNREIALGHSLMSHHDLLTILSRGRLDLSFVAEVNGKIAGFIISQLVYLMIPFTEVCVIQGILVHPEYKEQGIGRELIKHFLGHCQSQGINTIRALIPEHNVELRRFAEENGFSRSRIINFDKKLED